MRFGSSDFALRLQAQREVLRYRVEQAQHAQLMEPADSIGRLGFRRWYERQLIQSHAYLVTCILCLVMAAAGYETLGARGSLLSSAAMLACVLAAGALGIFSWSRYRDLMVSAEGVARFATCERCEAYGRLQVLDSGATAADAPGEERLPWMKVKCRKCGHGWTIG